MKTENITKYVCDVCKKIEYVSGKESSPMQEIRLPMKYYDECGRQHGLTNQKIDICHECFAALERDLSQHYEMSCIAYGGAEIERRSNDEKSN